MLIPPKYILTPKISEYLQTIHSCHELISSIHIPPEVENNIRRQSTLKSSLFSARIEGNTLTAEEVINRPSQDQRKVEVFNILKALNQIHKASQRDLTTKFTFELHQQVMAGLIDKENLGQFRQQTSAIFNSSGIAIYMTPPKRQIRGLMDRLMKFINSSKEPFIPITACLAHYTFEKIHPFMDGNGRVGRLLIQAVLHKKDYGMKGLLNIEEFLDNHRPDYYRALEDKEKDTTDYLEFMLEAIANTASEVKQLVLQKQKLEAQDYLLPRRAEILNIIKDHQMVNFDFLRRRFLGVNERTLRFDLKKLTEAGFCKKRGNTKGVWYEAKE